MSKAYSEEELSRFIDYLHERLTDGDVKEGELDNLLIEFEEVLHHSHEMGKLTDAEYGFLKTQFTKMKFKLHDLGLTNI